MMAALARVVHNRQGAADPEHNRRENNQQGGLHGDLATAGPPNLPHRPNYRGSNEPTVNARHLQANGAPHQPRQLGEVHGEPPRLVLRQALGCRPALQLIGKQPAAVLFTHDLTLSEGFKKIRQGFGLSVAQFDCDGGQLALDFGP